MADIQTFLIIAGFLTTGIVLVSISAFGFRDVRGFKNLAYVFILKAAGDIFYLLASLFDLVLEMRTYFVIFISAYGYLYLASVIVLTVWLHRELYEERSMALSIPLAVLLASIYIPIERVYLLMVEAFHVGLTTAVSLYAAILSIKMARKRKGGTLIWILGAIYAILIAIAPIFSICIVVTSLVNPSPIFGIIFAVLIFLIDLIPLLMYLYYEKVIRPLLKGVL